MEGIIIGWVIAAFIVASFGSDREIGFGTALVLCIVLSPLIGAIFVATSKKKNTPSPMTAEGAALAQKAIAKYRARDYQGAISDYLELLTTHLVAPHTNFKLACLYSLGQKKEEAFSHLAKAVEQGFAEFKEIKSSNDLAWLRSQPEFAPFAQGGYKLASVPPKTEDAISKIEKLGELKAKGLLTEEEFLQQKRKILGN
jgi:hypothetical protein